MARPARPAPSSGVVDRTQSAMQPDRLAEAVRAACERAAVSAYEDAGLRGLCEAGRWEAALGALQSIDLQKLIESLEHTDERPG